MLCLSGDQASERCMVNTVQLQIIEFKVVATNWIAVEARIAEFPLC